MISIVVVLPVALVTVSLPSVAQARLYHVPLASGVAKDGNHRRRNLLGADEVDQDNLYQARGVQYADLKVGCPAQTQSGIISTASSAIGFPCSGCTNDCGEGSHNNGLYHEKLSTCFEKVACGDCLLSSNSCYQKQCPISMSYVEGSSWKGYEVQDMVSLGGEDDDDEAFPLRFGCQTDITGLFEDQIPDGIFGMNKEPGSAISQWTKLGYLEESAFSLCYTVREDVKKKSGVMVLGGSDSRLHESPMLFVKDVGTRNYEVRVKDIRLRKGSALSASAGSTTEDTASLGLDGKDTIIVDSATTCTYLDLKWRSAFQTAWQQMTNGKHDMMSHLSITAQELDELPTVVFELEGTGENETISIDFPPMRYMEKSDLGGYDFCMYFDSITALGNTFMSGHDVLHDLENKSLGFAKSKCEIHTITQPTVLQPGYSVETDGDKEGQEPASPKLKPVVLHTEPIHKREDNPATTPLMDTLYVLIGVGTVMIAVFAFFMYRARRWPKPTTKHAYQLSWISLVITLMAIVAGMALFATTGSSLFFVLGMENCVDFLSSAIVLWRFFAPSANVTDELEAKLKHREQRASVAISMTLVLLGLAVWATAIADLTRGEEEPTHQEAALAISFVSIFLFGLLTIVKFKYAKALKSPSLYKDGICSLIGTTLSVSLFVTTLIIDAAPSAWWIDPAVAIGCGLASIVYGTWTLHVARTKEGVPICSLHWWFLSQGGDEDASRKDLELKEERVGHAEHDFT